MAAWRADQMVDERGAKKAWRMVESMGSMWEAWTVDRSVGN